jgi:hypothetical protein
MSWVVALVKLVSLVLDLRVGGFSELPNYGLAKYELKGNEFGERVLI